MTTTRRRLGAVVLALFCSGALAVAGSGPAAGGVVGVPFDAGPCWVGNPSVTHMGTSGNNIILGTAGPDLICGMGGSDTLKGLGGDDVIYGGSGDDFIYGAEGRDVAYGGDGDDDLYGGEEADVLDAGDGNDEVFGGGADDAMYAGAGDDIGHTGTYLGSEGPWLDLDPTGQVDWFEGGDGNDTLWLDNWTNGPLVDLETTIVGTSEKGCCGWWY